MTASPKAALVKQQHRDAAADILEIICEIDERPASFNAIRRGEEDLHPVVQRIAILCVDDNDAPEARLEMVRVAVQAIIDGGEPVPLAKAALDFIDLTQAERETMRGEQPLSGPSGT